MTVCTCAIEPCECRFIVVENTIECEPVDEIILSHFLTIKTLAHLVAEGDESATGFVVLPEKRSDIVYDGGGDDAPHGRLPLPRQSPKLNILLSSGIELPSGDQFLSGSLVI